MDLEKPFDGYMNDASILDLVLKDTIDISTILEPGEYIILSICSKIKSLVFVYIVIRKKSIASYIKYIFVCYMS